MKKLFTFCASALLAFTLSAQAEQPEGTWYLGAGNAEHLMNLFTGVELTAEIGYAVKDDLIIGGTIKSHGGTNEDENVINADVIYFKNGSGFGAHIKNLTEVEGVEGADGERSMAFSVGKMVMVGAISDRLYVYPNVEFDSDMNANSGISFGFRF